VKIFLKLLMLLMLIEGCQRLEFDNEISTIILKGQCESNFPLIKNGTSVFFTSIFDESSIYEDHQWNWNRLFGLTPTDELYDNFGMWIWRWNPMVNKIDYGIYTCINGELDIEYLFSLSIKDRAELHIEYDKGNKMWVYECTDPCFYQIYLHDEGYLLEKDFKWLGPAFKNGAPHNITITYKFFK